MTTKNQIVAAVDIGTTKVVAVAGIRDEFGKINILGYGISESKGVVRGSVQNVSEVSAAINKAVAKCKSTSGCDFKNIFVGIAGQNVRVEVNTHSKFIDSGIIRQADIEQLTKEVYTISKDAGEEIIHVIPQGYTVDGGKVFGNVAGCTGRKLEGKFFVAVGRANCVSAIRQAVTLSGLNIVKIILEHISIFLYGDYFRAVSRDLKRRGEYDLIPKKNHLNRKQSIQKTLNQMKMKMKSKLTLVNLYLNL